jgi:hypothetical protein
MASFIVQSKINLFKKQFGAGHYELAKWAVFPVGITVDMLYQLWSNFKEDFKDKEHPIHIVSVSDILLSPFFKPIGNGIFEPDKEVRTTLLEELRAEDLSDTEGGLRLQNLAFFVSDYARQCLLGEQYASFRETLLWNAQATLNPAAALSDISRMMQASLLKNNRTEILRLRELLELFAIQEKGQTATKDSTFNNLLQYSVALKGGFMNASAPQIQQKMDGLGLVLHTEPMANTERIQLPASLVGKGILQKMVLDKPKNQEKKRQVLAMLVGINDYTAPLPQLKGTGNDIDLIEKYLKERFSKEQEAKSKEQGAKGKEQEAKSKEQGAKGKEQEAKSKEQGAKGKEQEANVIEIDLPMLKTTKLFNQTATKAGILEQFKFLASQAQDDDFVFFSFSGLDTEIDEKKPVVEVDISSNMGSNIGDNIGSQQSYSNAPPPPPQYQQAYQELPTKKVGIFMTYDSRNVGEVYENYLEGNDFLEIVKAHPRVNFVFWLDCCKSYSFFAETTPNMLSINACSDGQTAKETTIEGKTQGAFSYHAVKKLTDSPQISYSKLIADVTKSILKTIKDQTPFIQSVDENKGKVFLQDSFIEAKNTKGGKKTTLVVVSNPAFSNYFKNKLDTQTHNYSDSRTYSFEKQDTLFALYDSIKELSMSQEDYANLEKAQNVFIVCNYYSTTLKRFLENKPNVIVFMGCSEGEEGITNDYDDGKKYDSPNEKYSCGLFIKTFIEILDKNKERTLNYSELFSEVYKAVSLKTDAQRPQLLTFGKTDLSLPFLNGAFKTEPKNTEGVSAPRLQIGMTESIDEKERKRIFDVFQKAGGSLFFDLAKDNVGVDYLLCEEEGLIYLKTPYDDAPVFGKANNYDLIPLFNNIDSVANWHFTLDMKPKAQEKTIHEVDIDFYKVNKMQKMSDVWQDWKVPIVIECEPNKEAEIKLKITNKSPRDMWVSTLYLGKDFGVTNQFLAKKLLKISESAWMEYENQQTLPLIIQEEYLSQNKKQITEYIKVFISETEFDTADFNREGLTFEQRGITRGIGSRAVISQHTLENITMKTVIYTLKIKEDSPRMAS